MGVRGNIGIQKFNELQKSMRRRLNDPKVVNIKSGFKRFQDHTKMKGHEFAEFQKKIRAQNKANERRFRIVFGAIMGVIIIVLSYYLFF